MIQVFFLHENILAKWQRRKNGKINDKMENTTSGRFFLHWFQHDISMVSRIKEISCSAHKPIGV